MKKKRSLVLDVMKTTTSTDSTCFFFFFINMDLIGSILFALLDLALLGVECGHISPSKAGNRA